MLAIHAAQEEPAFPGADQLGRLGVLAYYIHQGHLLDGDAILLIDYRDHHRAGYAGEQPKPDDAAGQKDEKGSVAPGWLLANGHFAVFIVVIRMHFCGGHVRTSSHWV